MNTFKLSSGKDITFLEYYRQQYNIQITDVKQPLLLSKLRTKTGCGEMRLIYLVPEICNMTGLTDTMRNDVLVMKDIANYTRITPSQRNFSFKKFLTNIRNNSHAQEILQEWGLNIAEHPLETEARILPSEKIFFHNKSAVTAPINAIWANCFKSQGLFRSTDLKNWLLVYTIKETNLANKFKEALKKVGPGLGIEILNPNAVLLKSDKIDCYISSLKENITSSTQVMFVAFFLMQKTIKKN